MVDSGLRTPMFVVPMDYLPTLCVLIGPYVPIRVVPCLPVTPMLVVYPKEVASGVGSVALRFASLGEIPRVVHP